MKRIIEEVFQAEDEVSAVLGQARQRASEIKRAAEKEASETVSEAKRQAQEVAQAILDEARQQATRIRQDKLREAERAAEALRRRHAGGTDGLVEKVCQVILATGIEGGA